MNALHLPFVASTPQEKELQKLARSTAAEQRLVSRARLVVARLQGLSAVRTADNFATTRGTVQKWFGRFALLGVPGLHDNPRAGAPAKYGVELQGRVLAQLELAPPAGYARWDGALLERALGVHRKAVWKVLKKEGISLARKRSWCISKDPAFAEKAADVIGLYLNPPVNAVVLSVDEKPSIQALERRRGFARAGRTVVRGEGSTYTRHGVTNLFAALNVQTGSITAKTTGTKKREDFLAFMDDVVAGHACDISIHVVLDNLATHKRCDEWLAAHPNVKFHFTPTSASWLNQVEIFFNILTRKALDGASFNSIEEVNESLAAFIKDYNQDPKPFKWRKREVKGSQLRNTAKNLRD